MNKPIRQQHGFTLIELVVVISILGILAAISVPMITNYLSQAKERAYSADVAQVQAAVDAYYSAPDNEKFIGKRQYPIWGKEKASNTPGDLHDDADDSSTAVTSPGNPLGGSEGGSPVWVDDGDDIRSAVGGTDEENLNGPDVTSTEAGWHMANSVRQTKTYYVDSRDFIINMEELVTLGLLDGIPASAATENRSATSGVPDATDVDSPDGSYIYYINADGKVETVMAVFAESDKTGFQGVHP